MRVKQAVFVIPNSGVHAFEDDEVKDGEEKTGKKTGRQKATDFLNTPEGKALVNQEGGVSVVTGIRREVEQKLTIGG